MKTEKIEVTARVHAALSAARAHGTLKEIKGNNPSIPLLARSMADVKQTELYLINRLSKEERDQFMAVING